MADGETLHEPALAQLMDPLALERRLADARARRAAVMAGRNGAAAAPGRLLRGPAVVTRAAVVRPASLFVAGLATGLAFVAIALALTRPATPPQAPLLGARALVPSASSPLALAAASAPVAVSAPAPLVPPARALRPAPRPAALASPPAPPATRSAGKPGRAVSPATGIRALNAATLGAAAVALGLRERVALPGLIVSIDGRGLRIRAHRGGRGRRWRR
jgi:hypothetical protein